MKSRTDIIEREETGMDSGTVIIERKTTIQKVVEPVEVTGTGITEAQAEAIRKQPRFSGIFPDGGKFERRIPLTSPVIHGDEQEFIEKALMTGLNGSAVSELEKEIAAYTNKAYAAALSSGSAAVFMALRLAEEKGYGKRVFCSDFVPVTMMNPVLWADCDPIFVDVSCRDWSMDPEALRVAFQMYPDVKIVLMNHAYGFPGQVVEIKRICESHGAILIEDASESFGARCFSSLTGTIGDYGILDFGTDRIITGMSGGMLLTNDEDSYRRVKHLASGALTDASWQQITEAGYDCVMNGLAAAMIRAQLPHLEDHIAKKREIYERYQEVLEESGLLEMTYAGEGMEPNYRMICAICESGIQFEETRSETGYAYTDQHGTAAPMEICDALSAFGAEARPVYKPFSMQPAFQKYDLITTDGRWSGDGGWCGDDGRSCDDGKDRDNGQGGATAENHTIWNNEPVSHELFKTAICLPSDVSMTEKEQDIIIEIILSCFDKENLDREAWEEALSRIS